MSIPVQMNVKPFEVPNYVQVEIPDGLRAYTAERWISVPLSAVTPEGLDRLAGEFRRQVFEKAGIPDPKAQADMRRALAR